MEGEEWVQSFAKRVKKQSLSSRMRRFQRCMEYVHTAMTVIKAPGKSMKLIYTLNHTQINR